MTDIHQTAGQVTGVSRFHGSIGKTLTGTMGGNEVFQHRHSLLKVGKDGVLNNLVSFSTGLLGLCHQTTDAGQLLNLVFGTTGTGIKHHVHGIETLISLGHLLHQHVAAVVVDVSPSINHLIVTLVIGDEAHIVIICNLTDFLSSFGNQLILFLMNNNVVKVEGESCFIGHAVAKILDTIKESTGFCKTNTLTHICNNIAKALLGNNLIYVANFVRNDAIHYHTA